MYKIFHFLYIYKESGCQNKQAHLPPSVTFSTCDLHYTLFVLHFAYTNKIEMQLLTLGMKKFYNIGLKA